MEINEDFVIIGAGISGLATSLAFHRLGLRSLVLESSESLRVTGFALSLWTNAWSALDALGIANILRQDSLQISGYQVYPQDSSLSFADLTVSTNIKPVECRRIKRQELLETLEKELPKGTIRYSSKVVNIEESGRLKLVHLADSTVIKTKVLIGCDGVNSFVAKWLDLQKPVNTGRTSIRGFVHYPEGHNFEPKMHVCFGGGIRFGAVPCDDTNLYWFSTHTSSKIEGIAETPLEMKQFVLSRIENAPKKLSDVVRKTDLQLISRAQLKLRLPWNILLGNVVKNNVCVAGDALHPMTPDIGQGGCSALEDGVILAKCLAEALLIKQNEDGDEYQMMKMGLEKYAKQRRWRSFSLVIIAYLVGFVQECDGKVMSFLRKMFLDKYSTRTTLKMGNFDCGKLIAPSNEIKD